MAMAALPLGGAMAAFGAGGAGAGSALMSPMVLSSLIGGGLSIGGGALSGLFGQSSADKAMDFQKDFAQRKYRWMVRDLEKAGLNRMLAVGASPGGLSGGFTAQMPNPLAGAAEAFADIPNRVLQYNAQRSGNRILKEQELIAAHTRDKTEWESYSAYNEALRSQKETELFQKYGEELTKTDLAKALADILYTRAAERVQSAAARSGDVEADYAEMLGPGGKLVKDVLSVVPNAARGVGSAVGSFIRGGRKTVRPRKWGDL